VSTLPSPVKATAPTKDALSARQLVYVPLRDITRYARNPRKNAGAIPAVKASLKEFGWRQPIVLDKQKVIVIGDTRYQAACELADEAGDTEGTTTAPCLFADDLTPQQIQALRLVDNKTHEFAEWDNPLLQIELADLPKGYAPIAAAFTQEELQAIAETGSEPIAEEASEETPVPLFTNEQIIEAAFAYFRATGFPYRKLPLHVCMQEMNKLSSTEKEHLIRTDMAYHVADTYHPQRYHAAAEKMKSQYSAFCDDLLLRKALTLELQYGAIGDRAVNNLKFVHGTQPLSNFRPGFALYLYRKYAPPGATVLDTSTGYGGRLVGFLASGLPLYIGIDPNTATHAGNMTMVEALGMAARVELHNVPAEDVDPAAFKNRCQFAFTSPPYFAKEHYSDEATQSWIRYQTGEAWREGFLIPMMHLQHVALNADSYAVVNIADVTLRGKTYPLVEWTKGAALTAGFQFVTTEEFSLSRRFGAGQEEEVATEPVLIFKKPR